MNKKQILIFIVLFTITISGCVSPSEKTIVGKTYEVVSVNQFYRSGEMIISINYVDESGKIATLTQSERDEIQIVKSDETKLVYDSYDKFKRYSTLYLNVSKGINGKESIYTEVCGKGCIRTIDVPATRIY
jgi:hypothetical protein